MFFELLLYKLIDILDFGMVHFDLKQNVAKHVRIPPKPKPKKRRVQVLHEKELATWLHYLDNLPNTRANRQFKIICDTLLASALRINELLALEITDLNFDCSEIEVNKTLMWKRADKKLGTKTITTSPLHNKFLITYQYHLKPLTLKVQTIFLLLVP